VYAPDDGPDTHPMSASDNGSAAKLPPDPDGPASTASTTAAPLTAAVSATPAEPAPDDAVTAPGSITSAPTKSRRASFADPTGLPLRHTGTAGDVTAHPGNSTNRNRDPKSPPNACPNPAYDTLTCTRPAPPPAPATDSTTPLTPSARATPCDTTSTATRGTPPAPAPARPAPAAPPTDAIAFAVPAAAPRTDTVALAVLAAVPEPASADPTHTGRTPARTDPADGSAPNRPAARAGAVSATTAEPAAGHDVTGRCHSATAGTRTARPCTTCTGTAAPSTTATTTADKHPATSATAATGATHERHRRPAPRRKGRRERRETSMRETITNLQRGNQNRCRPGTTRPAGHTPTPGPPPPAAASALLPLAEQDAALQPALIRSHGTLPEPSLPGIHNDAGPTPHGAADTGNASAEKLPATFIAASSW
jgi:hypothetical protein